MKDKVPSLGFEDECWYGDGLLEITLSTVVKCFIERTMAHQYTKADGKPWCIFIHDFRSSGCSRLEYVTDLFEAKMLVQAMLDEVTARPMG